MEEEPDGVVDWLEVAAENASAAEEAPTFVLLLLVPREDDTSELGPSRTGTPVVVGEYVVVAESVVVVVVVDRSLVEESVLLCRKVALTTPSESDRRLSLVVVVVKAVVVLCGIVIVELWDVVVVVLVYKGVRVEKVVVLLLVAESTSRICVLEGPKDITEDVDDWLVVLLVIVMDVDEVDVESNVVELIVVV